MLYKKTSKRVRMSAFESADPGWISRQSFHEAVEALGICTDAEESRRVFTVLDRAGAGVADRAGFARWMRGSTPKDNAHAEIRIAFRLYDHDGDGFLSLSDLQNSADIGHAEASRMMQALDLNHDGKVSFAEFARAMGLSLSVHSKAS